MSTLSIQLTKYQETALGQQLSVGGAKHLGLMINAGLISGFRTHFQGSYLTYQDTDVTKYSRNSIDGDLGPYRVLGVDQLMGIRSSDSTAVASGFLDAAAAGDTGVLRLTCRVVNGANAIALTQENALWIAPSTNFTALFEIKEWTTRTHAVGVSFFEIGLASTCVLATDLVDAAKVPAYVDGTDDKPFVTVKLYGSQGRMIVRPSTSAALLTSSTFDVPAGAFNLRFEYSSAQSGGSPTIALFINDRFTTSIATSITGPLQIFARAAHGAGYVAATHTVSPILDIDSIVVAMPV
jgi:hypothetical protein